VAQIRRTFGAPQHATDVARTGAEGIRRVAEREADVVLLDLQLPDRSGLEVYQQIRRLAARIPVIFVTEVRPWDRTT
jgi:two-component system nitrogen regulation response regulator GlnG